MAEAGLTCLDFWCRAGSAFERPGEEGLAHFLEHMVFKGSERLGAGEFDLKVEALGGSSNAATGFDDVHFHVLVPPEGAEEALELLLDLVLEPALRSDAFAMERDVVLEEIAQYRDQPDEVVVQKLLMSCCSNHPYGRPILGWEDSLNASTPATMSAFHQRRYRGPNCAMVVAGALPNHLHTRLTQGRLAQLDGPEQTSNDPLPTLQVRPGRDSIAVDRLEAARLLMAWPAAPAHQQRTVMGYDLATTLLAEGRRSRLVERLREDLQIVESIDMDLTTLEQGSLVMLEACCAPERIDQVEQEVKRILASAGHSPITEEELQRSRQLVGNGLRFSLEAPGSVAAMTGPQALWRSPQNPLAPLKDLDAWRGASLQQQVLTQLHPDQAFTLIALPGEGN
ncbi:MAG: M16 family metallopeptidase [Synechococcus sp.]